MGRLYQNKTVLDAANERIDWILKNFETIVVSVSGGKDSTLLFDLLYHRAFPMGREINVFFLDQEAEYASTIEIVKDIMSKPGVIPHWYQVPVYMTSAASYDDDLLYAWGPDEKWMRPKDQMAIHSLDVEYPKRFYPFLEWWEKQWQEGACLLVGLRAEESLNRYRAVIKNPGVEGVLWSTKGKGAAPKLYPIYDWSFDDIWHYFYNNGVKYNRIYDFMHSKDEAEQITKYRVSNLIHEKAFGCLTTLQEFEHDTYERLAQRLKGIRTAARYADENAIYSNLVLPEKFGNWKEYRDYLLSTMPKKRVKIFESRFKKQAETEHVYKQQAKQIMINDWENNVPVVNRRPEETQDWRQKWWDLL